MSRDRGGFAVSEYMGGKGQPEAFKALQGQHARENVNPKHVQAQKEGKIPFEFIPLRTLTGAARVLQHGAAKYGRKNWRKDKIMASTYQGAIMRHLSAYYEGETVDPDSGCNHLSHIIANCMVMLDATYEETLIDDRMEMESKDV